MEQGNSNFTRFLMGVISHSQDRQISFTGFDEFMDNIKQRAEQSLIEIERIDQIEEGLKELSKAAKDFQYQEFEMDMENSNVDVYRDLEDYIELRRDKLLQQFYKVKEDYKRPEKELFDCQEEWDRAIYNSQRLKELETYINSIQDVKRIVNILTTKNQQSYLVSRIRYLNSGEQLKMNEAETFIYLMSQLSLFAKYILKTISIGFNISDSSKNIHITIMQNQNGISLAMINNKTRQIKLIAIAKNRKIHKDQLSELYQSYEIDEEMMIQQDLNKLYDIVMDMLVELKFVKIIQKVVFTEQIEQLNLYRQSLGNVQIDIYQLMEMMSFTLN